MIADLFDAFPFSIMSQRDFSLPFSLTSHRVWNQEPFITFHFVSILVLWLFVILSFCICVSLAPASAVKLFSSRGYMVYFRYLYRGVFIKNLLMKRRGLNGSPL